MAARSALSCCVYRGLSTTASSNMSEPSRKCHTHARGRHVETQRRAKSSSHVVLPRTGWFPVRNSRLKVFVSGSVLHWCSGRRDGGSVQQVETWPSCQTRQTRPLPAPISAEGFCGVTVFFLLHWWDALTVTYRNIRNMRRRLIKSPNILFTNSGAELS